MKTLGHAIADKRQLRYIKDPKERAKAAKTLRNQRKRYRKARR